jgi:hypothetical protein
VNWGEAQISFSEPVDYEKLFADNLSWGDKVLNLSGKKIGDEGLKILLKQDFIKKLKKLDLRYNDISPNGAETLAHTPPLPKLKTLILKHNFFADEGTVAVAKPEPVARRRLLGDEAAEVGPAGPEPLGAIRVVQRLVVARDEEEGGAGEEIFARAEKVALPVGVAFALTHDVADCEEEVGPEPGHQPEQLGVPLVRARAAELGAAAEVAATAPVAEDTDAPPAEDAEEDEEEEDAGFDGLGDLFG